MIINKVKFKEKPSIRVVENPFIWNGTFLGKFDESVIINETSYCGLRYVLLNIKGFKTYGILVSSTALTPADLLCIYDELKEIFGLVKTGTHSLTIKSKTYVVYRAIFTNNIQFDELLSDDVLNKYKHLEDLKTKVKNLLAYRHLLGVSPNSESGIKIRKSGTGLIFPISLNDKFTVDKKEGVIKNGLRTMSDKNFAKWFPVGDSFADTIKKMLYFKTEDDIPEMVDKIRDKIEEIVNRINKEFIWLENIVCRALVNYLEDSEVEETDDFKDFNDSNVNNKSEVN